MWLLTYLKSTLFVPNFLSIAAPVAYVAAATPNSIKKLSANGLKIFSIKDNQVSNDVPRKVRNPHL